MGAFVLRFTINGKNCDIYRNGKTYGTALFKQNYEYDQGNITVTSKDVTLTPNSVIELCKDALYFIREKNGEFEDGLISKREHKRAKDWYDYHSAELEKLETFFSENLTLNELYNDYKGVWVKL